ncbi:unnamed protein product, partial [Prorocentrum cordatum]
MSTLEIKDVEMTLTGSFTAEVEVPLTEPYLISISNCQATAKVTSYQDVKTDAGWIYDVDFTGQLGRAIEDQIKKEIVEQFKKEVCGVDGLGKDLQKQMDSYINTTQAAAWHAAPDATTTRLDPNEAVHWKESLMFQWMRQFIADAEVNGLSWQGMLGPLFPRAPVSSRNGTGVCLFGSRSVACPLASPTSFDVKKRWDTADGGYIDLQIDHWTAIVREVDVHYFNMPTESPPNPDWLGVNASIGPLNLTFLVDIRIDSSAYSSTACIEKTVTAEIDIRHVAWDAFVLYDVPQDGYNELSLTQRYTPACLDAIATKFELTYLHLEMYIYNVHLEISPASNKTHTEHEARLVLSIEHLFNSLVVTAVNSNPEKINLLVESVVGPKLEAYVNDGGGLGGLLGSFGLGSGDGACPEESTPRVVFAVMRWTAAGAGGFCLAVTCIIFLKFFGSRGSWRDSLEATESGRRLGVCLARKPTTDLHWVIALPLLVLVCAILLVLSNTVKGRRVHERLPDER